MSKATEEEDEEISVRGIQEWRQIDCNGFSPSPRCWFGWTVTQDALIIGGGYDGKKTNSSFLNDLHSLNLENFSWITIPQKGDVPSPRYAHSLTFFPPTTIILFGGAAGKNYFDHFYRFDTATHIWTRLHPLASNSTAPLPRCAHAASRVSNCLIIHGGDNGSGNYLEDLWCLDVESQTLAEIEITSSASPLPRGWHSMSTIDSKIYVFGGCNESRREKILNDLWILSFGILTFRSLLTPQDVTSKSGSWEATNTSTLHARHSHASTSIGNEIVVLGGKSSELEARPMAVNWFNSDLKAWWWPEMKGTPPSSRYAHACVNYRSKVVVFGGCEIGKGYSSAMMPTLNDVHVLEVGSQPKSRELKRGPPQLPKDLAFLVNSEQFSDVVFIVEGKKLYAHRAILVSRSSYFKTMFLGSEKMKLKEANQEEISLQTGHDSFLAFLRYLYTETLPTEDIQTLLELLALSNLYQFDKLKEDLSYSIERHMNVENCSLLFQHAHHNLALDLKKVCLDFILKNHDAIQTTHAHSQLEDELVAEIVQHKLNREL